MNNPTALDPKSTLRENFLRMKRTTTKPATPGLAPGYTAPADPLYKQLQSDVCITFISGRTLTGKLIVLTRFDLGIRDSEGRYCHIPKHSIEQVVFDGK